MKIFGRKIKVEFESVKGTVCFTPFIGMEYGGFTSISIGWLWWVMEIYFQE